MLELALVLQLAAAAVGPGDVFGLQIGQPLALPVCRSILPPEKGACLVKMRKGETRGVVRFSTEESPSIARGDVTVIILDGKLEGVSFDTFGGVAEESVLKQLGVKYGEPDTTHRGESQNAFGVAMPWTSAVWNDEAGLQVSYSTRAGGVLIQTHKAAEKTAAEVAAMRRNQREL